MCLTWQIPTSRSGSLAAFSNFETTTSFGGFVGAGARIGENWFGLPGGVGRERMLSMPKPYPKEFRDDVVGVARGRDAGVTLDQIAADFGIHPMTLSKWLRQARIDDGEQPVRTTAEAEELVAARRRIRLLEQENEMLRRAAAYLGRASLPKE